MANLMVEKEADRVVALIERSGRAGYNGLVLSDYKLNFLDRMPDHYFKHVDRVKAAAEKAGIENIPGVFSIGYSNGLLTHDVNLAEGMPVENAPFVVKGGEAVLVPDPKSKLKNGDLETVRGDSFVGFGFQDGTGTSTFADHAVVHEGKTSCRMENFGGANCRLIQPLDVRPHSAYRLSCWVKTRDLSSTDAFRLQAIGANGRQPSFHEGGLESTRDWTRLEVVFNSQDQTRVNLYVGLWGAKSGTLWIDDIQVEELGLVSILRRDGCPLIVTSDDGKTVYVEGRDFEPVRDPKLGRVPYEGEYEFNHPPAPLRLTKDSRIKDGDRLQVTRQRWGRSIYRANTVGGCSFGLEALEEPIGIIRCKSRFAPC